MADLYVSYSSLGTASACGRKFELNKLFKHPERKFESIAMSAGSALHEGYQEYLVSRDTDKALWALGMAYPHVNCWDEFDDRSWEACMATLLAMIEYGNHSEWNVAYIKNHLGETVPAIEVPFEIEIRGLATPEGGKVFYTGYIDGMMERYSGRDFRSLDIKTHRSNMKDRTANFLFDTQQVPYGIVLEHILGRKIDSFEVDYMDTYLDLLAPRVVPHTYTKTPQDTAEWIVATILKIRMILKQMEMNLFLRADHGCVQYNRPCKFLDLCTSRDKQTIQKLLLLDGEAAPDREWNPWIKCYIDVADIGV